MAEFLVEAYQPRTRGEELAALTRQAQSVAQAMLADGEHVRHVRTTFVPEDEICFHLFEASSAEVVGEAIRRVGLASVRIVQAVHSPTVEDGAC